MTQATQTKKHETLRGGALLQALFQHAKKHNMDKHEVADQIGLTYSYLKAMSDGTRPVTGLSHEKLRKIAKLLGITFMQVLMLAEILKPDDFVQDREQNLERSLERAFQTMRDDPDWGRMAPTRVEWDRLSQSTKLGIAMLWEKEANRDLIEQARMLVVEPVESDMPMSQEPLAQWDQKRCA